MRSPPRMMVSRPLCWKTICASSSTDTQTRASKWLFKVPHGVFMKHPQLRLDECLFKVLSQEFEDVEAVIKDIEDNHQETFSKYEGFKKIRFQNTFAYLKHSLPYHGIRRERTWAP